jgi:hypothetical protein
MGYDFDDISHGTFILEQIEFDGTGYIVDTPGALGEFNEGEFQMTCNGDKDDAMPITFIPEDEDEGIYYMKSRGANSSGQYISFDGTNHNLYSRYDHEDKAVRVRLVDADGGSNFKMEIVSDGREGSFVSFEDGSCNMRHGYGEADEYQGYPEDKAAIFHFKGHGGAKGSTFKLQNRYPGQEGWICLTGDGDEGAMSCGGGIDDAMKIRFRETEEDGVYTMQCKSRGEGHNKYICFEDDTNWLFARYTADVAMPVTIEDQGDEQYKIVCQHAGFEGSYISFEDGSFRMRHGYDEGNGYVGYAEEAGAPFELHPC